MLVMHKPKRHNNSCPEELMHLPMNRVHQPLWELSQLWQGEDKWLPRAHSTTKNAFSPCHWPRLACAVPVLSTDGLIFVLQVELHLSPLEACSSEEESSWSLFVAHAGEKTRRLGGLICLLERVKLLLCSRRVQNCQWWLAFAHC